jgi:DNA-binding MarR family transcriptional regulator
MALRTEYLAMHRRSAAQFARLGVTAEQFVFLAALADGGAVTQRGLACRAISDPKTVRAMLLLMEKRGAHRTHIGPGRRLSSDRNADPKGGHEWATWKNHFYVFAPLLFPPTK